MPDAGRAVVPKGLSSPSREVEVVLASARTRLSTHDREVLHELLDEPIDWQEVLRLAHRHQVSPVMHHSLKQLSSERVPAGVLDELTRRRAEFGAWNLRNISELFVLQDLLAERGVVAVPLKGPALAAAAYGDISLRLSSDIDLLVRLDDLETVHELLEERGYHVAKPASPRDVTEKEQSYLHPHSGIRLEIHWRVSNLYRVDRLVHRAMRDGLDHVCVLHRDVPILPLEPLLVVLSVHGAHHRWERLKWVCDVAELLHRHRGIEGARLHRVAREVGCERVVELGIDLAVRLLGAPCPQGFEVSSRAAGLGSALADRLRSGAAAEQPNLGTLISFHGSLEPSWTGRGRILAYFLHSASTPRDRGGRNSWQGRLARSMLGWSRPVSARVIRRLGKVERDGDARGRTQ